MLLVLANLISSAAIADAALAAAAFSAPVARTVGLWAGGYVALSFSLALCWVLLVSAGRIYQHRLSTDLRGSKPALKWYRLLRYVQHEDATFLVRPAKPIGRRVWSR